VPTLRGECLSVVRPIRPSGRATLHCIIWMSARADPPEGPGFGRGGPGQEHRRNLPIWISSPLTSTAESTGS
jgi:hypothetical protein